MSTRLQKALSNLEHSGRKPTYTYLQRQLHHGQDLRLHQCRARGRSAVRSNEEGACVEDSSELATLAQADLAAAGVHAGSGAFQPHAADDSNGSSAGSDFQRTAAVPQPDSRGGEADDAVPLPKVPWGLNTTLTVMALWLLGFYLAAYTIVPWTLELLAIGPTVAASSRGQALRHLLLDLTQMAFTVGILARALREYDPRRLGLFVVKWRPVKQWLPTVLGGCAMFPLVDWVHKNMVALLATGAAAGAPQAANAGSGVVASGDWVARAMWFSILAVCAPVWEEVMFRGFLLPSLARRLSPPAAVAATSLVFAMVHFTREGFLPLLILGAVFGTAYTRTRNLLPCMLLHSLWNVCLLAQIILTGGTM